MTCIVGIEHGGRVYIGGDSAGSSGGAISVRADTKVFTTGPYVMGFAGSFRMGQLLHYAFDAPRPDLDDIDRFMVTVFVDAVRKCFKHGGYLTVENGSETGGVFLVGVKGDLFRIDSDFQVGRLVDGYAAIGSGEDFAHGSLFATASKAPRVRVMAALEAAAYHSDGVCGPFVIERSPRLSRASLMAST